MTLRTGQHVAGDRDVFVDQMPGPVDAFRAGEGGVAPLRIDQVKLALIAAVVASVKLGDNVVRAPCLAPAAPDRRRHKAG